MARTYNKSLKDELVAKGEPVDSGVSSTSFPTDFKNKFVARLKDTNIDPNKKSFWCFLVMKIEIFMQFKKFH